MKSMRRSDRMMNNEEALNVLVEGEYGILSTVDSGGQPYGVPLNYVVANENIFLHGANAGSKLDNIANNSKVCFSVVGKTNILPSKFTTKYESVIAFGDAALVTEEDEKIRILREFIKKYSADFIDEGETMIAKTIHRTVVVKIAVKNITGKHTV